MHSTRYGRQRRSIATRRLRSTKRRGQTTGAGGLAERRWEGGGHSVGNVDEHAGSPPARPIGVVCWLVVWRLRKVPTRQGQYRRKVVLVRKDPALLFRRACGSQGMRSSGRATAKARGAQRAQGAQSARRAERQACGAPGVRSARRAERQACRASGVLGWAIPYKCRRYARAPNECL